MNDEDRQMNSTDTPGSGASPPERPDSLWGLWWAYGGPGGSGRWLGSRHSALLAYESKEAAQVQVEIEKDDYLCAPRDVTPLLLGVNPAAREQRDRLAGLLREVLSWASHSGAFCEPEDEELKGRIETELAAQEGEGREADAP
jgi:hypothetical protein